MEDLTYTDTQISEYTNDRYNEFSSFSYNYYYVSASDFLEGKYVVNDDGKADDYFDDYAIGEIKAALIAKIKASK